MSFAFGRPDPQDPQERDPEKGSTLDVIIISGSCCIPGMAPFDEQARRIVDQAIAETGVVARVSVMPATTAYFGGAPREVMTHLVSLSNQDQLGLPAVLVNRKAASYGVPALEDLKLALLRAADVNPGQEQPATQEQQA